MSRRPEVRATLAFVKLFVADLDRAAAFYGQALGYVAGQRIAAPEYDEIVLRSRRALDGALVFCRWRDGRALARGDDHGPVGLRVADVDAAYGRLLTAGGASRLPPCSIGFHRIAIVADLDGHALELIGPVLP